MAIPSTYTLDDIERLTGFEKRTVAYYVQQRLLPKVGRRGAKTRYPQLFVDRLLFIKMIRERQDRGEIGNLTLAEIREILDRVPVETIADVVAGREPMEAVDVRIDPDVPPEVAAVASHAFGQRTETPHNGEAVEAAPRPFQSPEPSSDVIEVDMSFADPTPPAVATAAEPEPQSTAPTDDPPRLKGLSDTRSLRAVEEMKTAAAAADEPPLAPEADADDEPAEGKNGYPPVNEMDRLGWSLARLQKVLTDAPRRKRGNTESWHRARITPELTISARNLTDVDAHMLDSVARILKKMLWTAWEE